MPPKINSDLIQSKVLWFTGLSGSGKSTLANEVKLYFTSLGMNSVILDGDKIRKGLCRDLGFSAQARKENIRRIVEVAKLFIESDFMVLVALISPYLKERKMAKEFIGPERFIEIFCTASLQDCEARDPKGLYKKARSGLISDFTGISAPYEKPLMPDLAVDTSALPIEESVNTILEYFSVKHT
nr:adenylyl-sulfate kinase [Spartinivicinus marinus]